MEVTRDNSDRHSTLEGSAARDITLADKLLTDLEGEQISQLIAPKQGAAIINAAWEEKINNTGAQEQSNKPITLEELHRRSQLGDLGITLDDLRVIHTRMANSPDMPIRDRAAELGFSSEEIETISLTRVVRESIIREKVDKLKSDIAKIIEDSIKNPKKYEQNRIITENFELGEFNDAFNEHVNRSFFKKVYDFFNDNARIDDRIEHNLPEFTSVKSPALQDLIKFLDQSRLPYQMSTNFEINFYEDPSRTTEKILNNCPLTISIEIR